MMLEASLHGDNTFATMTYRDEELPHDLSVRPSTISLFVKRLRKRGYKFRYFAVGEYGDNTFRPHYHMALFGFPTCRWGLTRKKEHCCNICEDFRRSWQAGEIYLGQLEPKSMAYVAGYINKKMTSEYDPRLEGRRPEFARMSLRPGLGHDMMHEVASTLLEFDLHKTIKDVPYALQHGKTKYPLGRYLRRSLRHLIGRDKNISAEALKEMEEKMQPMRQAAFEASENLSSHVLAASLGRRIQINAREARKSKVKKL